MNKHQLDWFRLNLLPDETGKGYQFHLHPSHGWIKRYVDGIRRLTEFSNKTTWGQS